MSHRINSIAKGLRKRTTDAERFLWKHLRLKQLDGFKFRRQEPIDNYIVDFVCFERRLIIEVDGGQHAQETLKDSVRDGHFKRNDFKVLRFWNNDVLRNIEGVLSVIRGELSASPSP